MVMTDIKNPILSLLLMIFFALLNAFFVAAEFSIMKLSPSKVKDMFCAGEFFSDEIVILSMNPEQTHTSIRFGIILSTISFALISIPLFTVLLEKLVYLTSFNINTSVLYGFELVISYIIVSFLYIIFGELMPKTIASKNPEITAQIVAWPLLIFSNITRYFVIFFIYITNFLTRRIGIVNDFEPQIEMILEE